MPETTQPSKEAMEAASKLRSDLIDGFALTEPEWLAISAAALDAFAADRDTAAHSAIADLQTELNMAQAYAIALRERNRALVAAIRGSLDTGHSITEVRAALIAVLAADAKAGEDAHG